MVIFFEGTVIFLIIIATYMISSIFFLQKHKEERIKNQIESYFKNVITNFSEAQSIFFPRRWRKMDLILPIIQKFDRMGIGDTWEKLRVQIIHKVLLPLARKKATSWFQIRRILSAQCFCLGMEEQDVEVVRGLLQDSVPIIYLNAAIAAINLGDELLINQIIDNMTPIRRLGQTIYLKLFDGAAPQIVKIVKTRLAQETDPYAKAICYKILMIFSKDSSRVVSSLCTDIHSDNIELQLSSIRYMAYNYSKQSISDLLKLSEDPRWEVRATSCRLLGELDAKQALEVLSRCLKDKVWSVRINAANALKSIGEEGVEILRIQNPQIDRFAYETAISVLNKHVVQYFDTIGQK
jgi:hypothetical protein